MACLPHDLGVAPFALTALTHRLHRHVITTAHSPNGVRLSLVCVHLSLDLVLQPPVLPLKSTYEDAGRLYLEADEGAGSAVPQPLGCVSVVW